MSTDERIDKLESLVSGLTELAQLQARRVDRLEIAVKLADNPADVAMAKLAADEARALARGAAELAAANLA